MNRNTHLASNWRGRVLLSMWVEDVKKPSLKAQLIEDESVKDIVRENFETGTEWELRAQVRSGVGLPSWKSEYSVIVNWGEIELKTQPKKVKNGRADWYENMKRKIVFVPNKAEENL